MGKKIPTPPKFFDSYKKNFKNPSKKNSGYAPGLCTIGGNKEKILEILDHLDSNLEFFSHYCSNLRQNLK